MEIAESFGKLFRSGWRPGRSILLCSWDGEEYGLIGSTNFGERHAKVLTKNAVVYLNVDMAVAGKKLMVKATPSLANLISSTLSRIPDPELNQSLLESWDKYLGALGSGSDFSVFLDHLGIISADISFKGEYGVYHSVFDSFHWMEKFGDPEFKYHKAMSQLWGLLAMRIADSRVLAFDYRAYGDRLTYLVNGMKSDFAEFGIDFSPLLSASQNLSLAGISFLKKLDLLRSEGLDSFARKFNSRGYLAERLFLDEDGIPMRKWFKHIVQAPGLDSGYGAVPFPGIVDALEAGNLSQALTQLERVVSRINQVASFVSSNTELALK